MSTKPLGDMSHGYLLVKIMSQTSEEPKAFQLINIKAFKLVHKINDHVRLTFTADIEDKYRDHYFSLTDIKTKVEVYLNSETQATIGSKQGNNQTANSKLIYKGIITKLKVLAHNNDYQIVVEAVSHSYEMDIQRKKRSFKDKTQKYEEMVELIGKENKGTCTYAVGQTWIMDKFFLQYEETDWEFLKRMASRLHTGLVVDPISDAPKLEFGVLTSKPADGNFGDCNFSVKQDSLKYQYDYNLDPSVKIEDYVYCVIRDSRKKLEIGDEITLAEKTLYVSEVTLEFIGSDLKYHYKMVSQKGLRQSVVYNTRIQGMSVRACVIDVVKDQVKLHLEFDKSHDKDKDCLFPVITPYSAENHTGWFMMPEINDWVELYFPDTFEDNAYVITSVRNKGPMEGIEIDAQYLRNKYGKQLMTGSQGLRFTSEKGQSGGSDQLLRVHAQIGVQITSDKPINIAANQDLLIRCKNTATFTAKNQLILSSKKKNIITMKDTILCEGTYLDKQTKAQAAVPEITASLEGIIFATAVNKEPESVKPEPDNKNDSKKDKDDNEQEIWVDPLAFMKIRRNKKSNTFGKDVRTDDDGSPRPHQGVDLYAPIGTDTFAVMKGKIHKIIDTDQGDYGKRIILEFKKKGVTYYAQYAHLSKISVKSGAEVEAGQLIGKTGETGNAKKWCPLKEDKHLHFEINKTSTFSLGIGTRIDPMPFFNAKMEVK